MNSVQIQDELGKFVCLYVSSAQRDGDSGARGSGRKRVPS